MRTQQYLGKVLDDCLRRQSIRAVVIGKRTMYRTVEDVMRLTLHLSLIGITLYWVSCIESTIHQQKLELDALDCRAPKGVSRSEIKSLCKHSKKTKEHKARSVHLLQFDRTQIVSAVTCSMQKTIVLEYCGSFSHSKIYEPFDVLKSEQVSHDACQQVYKTHLWSREDGKQATVSTNRPYVYKYISHGTLTANAHNVRCEGESFSIHGKMRSNMLSLVTARFLMRKIKIEIDPTGKIQDMDSGHELPSHCAHDRYCYESGLMYILVGPRQICPLYLIRSLQMTETEYMTADKRMHSAYVSHEHQLIIEKKHEFHAPEQCKHLPKMYDTNYHEVKIVVSQHTVASIHSLKPFSVDSSLEARLLHDYANFRSESLVFQQVDRTLHQLCEADMFRLSEMEKDPFKGGHILRKTGEIMTRFHCNSLNMWGF